MTSLMQKRVPARKTAAPTWAILTGEYPPQPGGVSDYTRSVARALAALGETVHVWSGPCQGGAPDDEGVTVHRLPDTFGPRSLVRLGRDLARLPGPTVLLVQYVPHAFGWKGMNVPFCLWLRCQPMRVVVMFHEVAFPIVAGQPWQHRLLARMTGWMAALVSRSACHRFVSTPSWGRSLEQLAPGAAAATWLPVPSTVNTHPGPQAVARCRGRIQPGTGGVILGHFGTFGHAIAEAVAAALPPLLRAGPQRTALLIGRGSDVFAKRLCRAHPGLAGQVRATGEMSAEEVAAHLGACDLLVQPYPDGANSRRTTLMAGLALGLPIVTTEGRNSEPLWRQSGAVEFVAPDDPDQFVRAAERLLRDPRARANLGKAARLLYEREFALQRTVERLRVGASSCLERGLRGRP